jgi:DNA polymerase III subunit delta
MPSSKNIYLIGGSDEFSVKEASAKLAGKLAPKSAGEFGVETIDGAATNQDEALKVLGRLHEALQTVGFFGAEKLVWLKSTNLLADDRAVTAEAVKEALTELGETLKQGVPDGVTLLISAIGLDKRRSLYLTLKKIAEVQEFDAPEAGKRAGEEDIAEFIQTKMRAEGKRLSSDGYQAFRSLVEPDLREIANELEKLCLYAGKRTDISDADVRAICSASRQAVIWELADALGARQLPVAIRLVEQMLENGEAAIGIVMLLVGQFRLMLLAKDLAQRKLLVPTTGFDGAKSYVAGLQRLPEEETAHFPKTKEGAMPSPWRLYRCAVAARNFTMEELIRAMDLLLEANRQLVSTQLDDRLVLEEAIAKIARKPAA